MKTQQKTNKQRDLSLEDIYKSDTQWETFLYELLKERTENMNISHRGLPSFEAHRNFVLSHPYQGWHVVFSHTFGPVGTVYLTRNDEIGVFILKDHQGKGYGSFALEALIKLYGPRKYLANISPLNEESKIFFQEHGFKHIQCTYALKVEDA